MAELAEDCKISASTLSRAVNGKLTRPISWVLIQRIAENGNKQYEILFKELARANGYVTKNEYEGIVEVFTVAEDNNTLVRRVAEYGKQMCDIVINELLKRGISVKLLEFCAAPIESKYSININYNCQIETVLGDFIIIWNFFIIEPKVSEAFYDVTSSNLAFINLKKKSVDALILQSSASSAIVLLPFASFKIEAISFLSGNLNAIYSSKGPQGAADGYFLHLPYLMSFHFNICNSCELM